MFHTFGCRSLVLGLVETAFELLVCVAHTLYGTIQQNVAKRSLSGSFITHHHRLVWDFPLLFSSIRYAFPSLTKRWRWWYWRWREWFHVYENKICFWWRRDVSVFFLCFAALLLSFQFCNRVSQLYLSKVKEGRRSDNQRNVKGFLAHRFFVFLLLMRRGNTVPTHSIARVFPQQTVKMLCTRNEKADTSFTYTSSTLWSIRFILAVQMLFARKKMCF